IRQVFAALRADPAPFGAQTVAYVFAAAAFLADHGVTSWPGEHPAGRWFINTLRRRGCPACRPHREKQARKGNAGRRTMCEHSSRRELEPITAETTEEARGGPSGFNHSYPYPMR